MLVILTERTGNYFPSVWQQETVTEGSREPPPPPRKVWGNKGKRTELEALRRGQSWNPDSEEGILASSSYFHLRGHKETGFGKMLKAGNHCFRNEELLVHNQEQTERSRPFLSSPPLPGTSCWPKFTVNLTFPMGLHGCIQLHFHMELVPLLY